MTDAPTIDREAAWSASRKLNDWVSGILAKAAEEAKLHPTAFERAFGIECNHHYGVTTHPFTAKSSIGDMVYELVRGWHHILTDDNHAWHVEHQPEGWSRLVIVKNEQSPHYIWKPSWVDDGPGATWFDQQFRVATPSRIAAEIGYHVKRAVACRADAARQRDTIRGRKARAQYESVARLHDNSISLVLKRWPQFNEGTPCAS